MARSRNDRKNSALAALCAGAGLHGAAEAANVQPRTIYDYLQDPDFRTTLHEIRAAADDLTAVLLANYATDAVELLNAVLHNPEETTTARVKAAGLILNESRAWRDTDIERRLTQLEQRNTITPGIDY